MELPKITFGIIVLNGEPFTRYCLNSIYPFAHEIIVVEGATPAARDIATLQGHSTDNTLEILYRFKTSHDPDNKIAIITAEDKGYKDGFWPGEKHEMSQAYATRATGNYLWQVDIDEFYKPEDIRKIVMILKENENISSISFKTITFWGGFDFVTDGWYLRRGASIFHRLFKWGEGYRYLTHRPPTVVDDRGVDLRTLHWLNGYKMASMGIFMYHYSLVFPKQAVDKSSYYQNAEWSKRVHNLRWVKNVYLELQNPYTVHNVYTFPSWIEQYLGTHPPLIKNLISDIASGKILIRTRQRHDINRLLATHFYRFNIWILKILDYFDRLKPGQAYEIYRRLKPFLKRIQRV